MFEKMFAQTKNGKKEMDLMHGNRSPIRKRVSNSLDGLVSLPLILAESLRDHCEDLRALRDWWEDEPRRTYQDDYLQMTKDLAQITKIIEQANAEIGGETGVK